MPDSDKHLSILRAPSALVVGHSLISPESEPTSFRGVCYCKVSC
jgi:hypothetical protein